MRLKLTDWEVKGFWPGEPLWTKSVESTVQRRGVTPWMPARVPGGVHRALEQAGLIADPNFGENSLLCEWVEHRWWVYRTFFRGWETDERVILRFNGVDDGCYIFLNGTQIAEHRGIYEPILCDVTRLVHQGEQNQLLVVLTQPPQEQGQIGWTSRTATQKARFGYKWDFCTHLVNIGIWQSVWLERCGRSRISEVSATTDVKDGIGEVRVRARFSGECHGATVRLYRDQRCLLEAAAVPDCCWDGSLDVTLRVEKPERWYPNGMGAQPLYDVELALEDDSDEWWGRIGFRSLSYARCEGAGRDALPYCPVINGERVYIRGVNLTPLDMCYGDVSEADYCRMFDKLRHMNVNAVRVWGGGIIETEAFYRLADEYGILVWQEFIQSSSGNDNRPCHDPAFLKLLESNSRAAVLARRNHVSLTWWSGGNELSDAQGRPVTDGDENIAMLKALVSELDPQRLFLPSSPSGPSFGLDNPEMEHHDVHGNWQYDGVRGHYAKYNASDSMLQSEFGADGMSSVAQLRRILPSEDFGVYTMKEHPVLRHHGEWWETLLYRDRPLFGEPGSVRQWVAVSQLMQAEAIRYTVLSNRRRRGQNGGSIIWQMNEPFPNVSCTNLVEYYGRPKQAYYAVRRAYAPTCVGLRYDSLIQQPDEPCHLTAWADDLTGRREGILSLTAYDMRGDVLFVRRERLPFEAGSMSMTVSFPVPALPEGVWMARVALEAENGDTLQEDFLFAQREEQPLRPLLTGEKPQLVVEEGELSLLLQNFSPTIALCVFGENTLDEHALLSDNAINLLPGESRLLTFRKWTTGWCFHDLAGRLLWGHESKGDAP